MDVDVLGNV